MIKDELESGKLIYRGRNKVWLVRHDGREVVVKEYHELGFLKGIVYTFFRKNKAQRAFDNALRLLERGILTPEPIDVVEQHRFGLLRRLYYVSSYTDRLPIRKPLTEDNPFNIRMTIDFAHFVARLHTKGVIHHDLNNTNVLYRLKGRHYEFMLIDINRVSFTAGGRPAADAACLENLTLFANRGAMFDTFAAEYVRARGWDSCRIKDIYKAKARHDRHWQRKKAVKSFIRKLYGK